MASTFTGLKLQGSIGKFGKVELSDICAFDEMPDGKVVSGTEAGALLLWEGNFIKCRFVQVGGKPCHVGEVTYVELDRKEKCLITAAADGMVRWWDYEAIDTAEVDADITLDFELLPVAEYRLSEGTRVSQMVDCGPKGSTRSFVIHDANGKSQVIKFQLTEERGSLSKSVDALSAKRILQLPLLSGPETVMLSEFHAGAIRGLVTLPGAHIAVTAGMDGTVRCWNYVKREVICSRKFKGAVTSLKYVPKALNNDMDTDGKHIIVGFDDGVVRVLCIGNDSNEPGKITLRSRCVMKPHSAEIHRHCFRQHGNHCGYRQ